MPNSIGMTFVMPDLIRHPPYSSVPKTGGPRVKPGVTVKTKRYRVSFRYVIRCGRVASSPKPPDLVFLIGFEIALEPFDLAVALESEDVGGEAVEEEAVVADHHGAAGEILERVLERAQGLDVEVVGRLVEQEDVAAVLEHLGQVDAVALAAGQLADLLLLVGAAEVEGADIGAAVHLVLADLEDVEAVADLLPYIVFGIERVAALVDIAEMDGRPDLDFARSRAAPGR